MHRIFDKKPALLLVYAKISLKSALIKMCFTFHGLSPKRTAPVNVRSFEVAY